ncbi:MAG: undecaprenyl-diphosphate phosphatase [Puniceicoccales bacterium]|jgi:undecaprenyl-diphosphatase|nr:undecaprenyl-diphosphate phosphatase [Puniceicoccales bacterium]
MKTFSLVIGLILSICSTSNGEDIFTPKEVIALGVTQGITEFLPVSSTAHLILVDKFMLDGGMAKSRSEADTEDTKSRAKNSYFSLIQFGSIAAILCLYRKRFTSIGMGMLGRDSRGRRLICNLLISFLPAAVIGLFIDGWLQKIAYNANAIAISLVIGGVIIFIAERHYGREKLTWGSSGRTIENLTSTQSLAIGLWQCLAFIPGMSRSMTSIVGGYGCGLGRAAAAEYSFLLGVLTLTAAAGYKFTKDFNVIFAYFGIKLFCLGIFAAFIASIVAIKIFVTFIARHGMLFFAPYRIILAIIIFC